MRFFLVTLVFLSACGSELPTSPGTGVTTAPDRGSPPIHDYMLTVSGANAVATINANLNFDLPGASSVVQILTADHPSVSFSGRDLALKVLITNCGTITIRESGTLTDQRTGTDCRESFFQWSRL